MFCRSLKKVQKNTLIVTIPNFIWERGKRLSIRGRKIPGFQIRGFFTRFQVLTVVAMMSQGTAHKYRGVYSPLPSHVGAPTPLCFRQFTMQEQVCSSNH